MEKKDLIHKILTLGHEVWQESDKDTHKAEKRASELIDEYIESLEKHPKVNYLPNFPVGFRIDIRYIDIQEQGTGLLLINPKDKI